MSRVPTFALGGLAAVLAGLLVLEVGVGSRDDAGRAASPSPRSSADATDAKVPALPANQNAEWATTILARPLFNPSRRPAPTSAVQVSKAEPDKLPRLTGVLISGAARTAIFASPLAAGKPVVVTEGGRVGNFQVQSIAAGVVTIVWPGGARALHPSFEPNAGGKPTPVAVPIPTIPKNFPSIEDIFKNGPPRAPGTAPQPGLPASLGSQSPPSTDRAR